MNKQIKKIISIIGEENFLLAMAYWYENRDCNFIPTLYRANFLEGSFTWDSTKEGWEYWNDLNNKLIKGMK